MHISGDDNCLADWMSRSRKEEEEVLPNYALVPQVYHLVHQPFIEYSLPNGKRMATAALEEEKDLPNGTLDWYDGCAFGRTAQKLFVPSPFRMTFLMWFHASRIGGHQGVRRTLMRMKKYVWWPYMQRDIEDFIRSCPICNALKTVPVKGEKGALSKPQLFQMVCMDAVGPREIYRRPWWIIVIIDHYSRYGLAQAVQKFTTVEAQDFLNRRWVAAFGAPRAVLTDRGAQFTAETFRNFVTKDLGARLLYASIEYPQGNGINESSHRIMEHMVKSYPLLSTGQFQDVVNECMLIYNATPHVKIGDTPSSLVFGCDVLLPGMQDLSPILDEEVRLRRIREYRMAPLLEEVLNSALEDSEKQQSQETTESQDFIVGDIVTYRLSESERTKIGHATGAKKYSAGRSFPCRVIEVHSGALKLKHLWLHMPDRDAPKAECKRLVRFIPDLMRDQAQHLFPTAPWLFEGEGKVKTKQSKRPSIDGLTWEELQKCIEEDTKKSRARKRVRIVEEPTAKKSTDVQAPLPSQREDEVSRPEGSD